MLPTNMVWFSANSLGELKKTHKKPNNNNKQTNKQNKQTKQTNKKQEPEKEIAVCTWRYLEIRNKQSEFVDEEIWTQTHV